MNKTLYKQRAIDLATLGLGHVSPNPIVGCVIVNKEKIIGEGYHHRFGGHHAEIVALKSVKNKELLKTSTLYVTLEPCSHFGKTPPCTDAIINSGIPHVVISCLDPNPLVSGQGIKKMIEAGIKVETGILEEQYRFINRRFFTFYRKKRPYIILKWAQTKNGFIDYERNYNIPKIYWISSSFNKTLVHKWRSEEMAILVGSNTIRNDNPKLTNRLWGGQNPIRLVLMTDKKVTSNAQVFSNEAKTIIFSCNPQNFTCINAELIEIKHKEYFLEEVMGYLYNMNIISVMVEGGYKTLQSFINHDLWDEARVIIGNIFFDNGIKAPTLNQTPKYQETIGRDQINFYYNTN